MLLLHGLIIIDSFGIDSFPSGQLVHYEMVLQSSPAWWLKRRVKWLHQGPPCFGESEPRICDLLCVASWHECFIVPRLFHTHLMSNRCERLLLAVLAEGQPTDPMSYIAICGASALQLRARYVTIIVFAIIRAAGLRMETGRWREREREIEIEIEIERERDRGRENVNSFFCACVGGCAGHI